MNKWIKNLKAGDKVFVNWRMGKALKIIDKITPKGYIKVGGSLYNTDGSERNSDVWSRCYLSEATPEAIKIFGEELTIKRAIKLMRETKEITIEQAKKIIDLLETPQNDFKE